MVILSFPIPTAMVDRELDALIEQSREQRRVLLDAPVWCIDAFGREYLVDADKEDRE